MVSVSWNGGKEEGFGSPEAAERFIERVCKKVAPGIDCSIEPLKQGA